ncbi:hypothetical protein ACYOEI_24775 [Singulisphaera rosea]
MAKHPMTETFGQQRAWMPAIVAAWRHLFGHLRGFGADFTIRSEGPGRVRIEGRIPRTKAFEIQEFCRRDLANLGRFSVFGTWHRGRILELKWSGELESSQRQRIRNYLVECLR